MSFVGFELASLATSLSICLAKSQLPQFLPDHVEILYLKAAEAKIHMGAHFHFKSETEKPFRRVREANSPAVFTSFGKTSCNYSYSGMFECSMSAGTRAKLSWYVETTSAIRNNAKTKK